MEKIEKNAKQFISDVLNQEYSKAQEQLQAIVNEKIKQRISEAAEEMEIPSDSDAKKHGNLVQRFRKSIVDSNVPTFISSFKEIMKLDHEDMRDILIGLQAEISSNSEMENKFKNVKQQALDTVQHKKG